MAKIKAKEKMVEIEDDSVLIEEPKGKSKGAKFKTARGKTTRYSCLYSTVPNKSRAPPRA